MRLKGIRGSRNIEDRRRSVTSTRGGKAGIGGVGLLIVLAVGYFAGIDVSPLLQQQSGSQVQTQTRQPSAQEDRAAQFTSQILATTEQVWSQVFKTQLGRQYTPPVLVLFSGQTSSPCGSASGASGPFYCPADKKAYLDTQFFATLSSQLGAKGDFAAAYVIAHEVAHHVQNELGIMGEVNSQRNLMSKTKANGLTVRLELQADCLSGVWAHNVNGLLQPGDLEEALNAARMIGDDHLQRQAGRAPRPHTFTHGTSAQRADWFARGYRDGDVSKCDTFSARRL